MRRVHWTVDLLEAHIVSGLLRDEGIPAWVFDADIVRQDWFKALALGGYRVVVENDDVERARSIVASYLGTAPEYGPDEMPACPRCAASVTADDPRPRRMMFLLLLALNAVAEFSALAMGASPNAVAVIFLAYALLNVILVAPGVVDWAIKHRYACGRCGTPFRDARRVPFADLAALAEKRQAST